MISIECQGVRMLQSPSMYDICCMMLRLCERVSHADEPGSFHAVNAAWAEL
jgi:hypothetical protein